MIAATNRDLEQAIQASRFRADLYYRLSVIPIRLPSLRERAEDIPLLVRYFAQKYGTRLGKRIPSVLPATLQVLGDYPWPRNVRELENVIERAVLLAKDTRIEPIDLPFDNGALPEGSSAG